MSFAEKRICAASPEIIGDERDYAPPTSAAPPVMLPVGASDLFTVPPFMIETYERTAASREEYLAALASKGSSSMDETGLDPDGLVSTAIHLGGKLVHKD